MPSEKREDVVTEASMESFPASDPPGWIHTVASTADPCEEVNVIDIADAELCEELTVEPLSPATSATSGPRLRRAKQIAIGVAAIGALAGAVALVRRLRS